MKYYKIDSCLRPLFLGRRAIWLEILGRRGQQPDAGDPMPGGSGLLEHLAERWDEVRSAALELLTQCPGACESSCVDCLQTYRNRFYHEYLDRHATSFCYA